MAPVGIAILGSGIFAREAHLPAIATIGPSFVDLKAVYSRSEKSAAELAREAQSTLKLSSKPDVYFDADSSRNLDTLLARPDITAVIVVLPITIQPSIVLKALGAGKHVISEKPVAPDVGSGLKLIAEYETKYKPKGLVWRVAENIETETGYHIAAKAIRDGKIGRVKIYNARVVNYIDKNSKWYNTPWRTIPDYQGGFLLDGGVHTIAALRVLLPSPIKTVSGFASLTKSYLAPHDTINAAVRSADGSHGLVELTWGAPTASRSNLAFSGITVTGADGWLSVNQVKVVDGSHPVEGIRTTVHIAKRDEDGRDLGEVEEILDRTMDGVPKELEGFVNAIRGDDNGLGNPQGALKDVAFIQAGLNSNGRPVDIDVLMRSDVSSV
ncbi:oxidoreductase family protein [Laetiporus sulphureus 93-53]|uniref:Oxidoreductase family protein n=1 Tax=Laetiporus sulphureus 93-53 TaxID=1314785 RepID=A0A165F008_9APHY|nr:oxidoreductase family protein [Laetiporus sulphureus 93-53]KZT08081.1 oxidoreductase family protein [Laetiporus sulphureus 93-53]